MDILVDVFYYDFVLTKIIELYYANSPLENLIPYLRIATVMSKKLRDEKQPVDRQVYIKEVYIKVLQVIKHCIATKKGENKSQQKLVDCVRGVQQELPALQNDSEFVRVRNTAFVIYLHTKENEEDPKYAEYIEKMGETLTEEQRKEFEQLNEHFDEQEMLENLKAVKLENPVMRRFTEVIKEHIDRNQKVTKRDSMGEKVDW